MAEVGLLIVGGLFSAYGAISSSRAQARYQRQQASVEREQASQVRERTRLATEQKYYEKRKFISTQKATIGGAGVSILGSPLEVMADTAAQFERDIAIIKQGGEASARLSGMRASGYESLAGSSETIGLVNAGTSLLTTGTKLAQRYL